MTKKDTAESSFLSGLNCSQSVISAFKDELDIDNEYLQKLLSGLGGGIGRLRLTCGAVSAMAVVISSKYGYIGDNDEQKMVLYNKVQQAVKEFLSVYNTTNCGELLGGNVDRSPNPTKRDKDFYEARPCKKIIGLCAEIAEKYIKD